MVKGILGRKVGMTQIYDEQGAAVPVTVIQAGPCHVLQIRTPERDGYEAVQLGFEDKPRRLASRSERGHVGPLQSKRSKKLAAAGVGRQPFAGLSIIDRCVIRSWSPRCLWGAHGHQAHHHGKNIKIFGTMRHIVFYIRYWILGI